MEPDNAAGSVRRAEWNRSSVYDYLRSGCGAHRNVQARTSSPGRLCHVNLYPARKDTSDQQKAASIAAITDISDAVQSGLSWGQSVADQIWAWRSQDGFPVTDPGQRRPAPPAMAPGLDPQLATVTPWIIRRPSQFRPLGRSAWVIFLYFRPAAAWGSVRMDASLSSTHPLSVHLNCGRPTGDRITIAVSILRDSATCTTRCSRDADLRSTMALPLRFRRIIERRLCDS